MGKEHTSRPDRHNNRTHDGLRFRQVEPGSGAKKQQAARQRHGKRHSQSHPLSMDKAADESEASQCNPDESEPNKGQVVMHIVHRGESRLSSILLC